jgi:hypothetical protein
MWGSTCQSLDVSLSNSDSIVQAQLSKRVENKLVNLCVCSSSPTTSLLTLSKLSTPVSSFLHIMVVTEKGNLSSTEGGRRKRRRGSLIGDIS